MVPSPRTDAYVEELRREFPRLRIVDKRDDWFSRLLDGAVRVLTFGRQSAYMTGYVTTIGATIYVPTSWSDRADLDRYVTMRHEAVHLRQFRRYTWLGMSLLYLLPIFPLGLAIGRARLEWEAYAETLRAIAETRGIAAAREPQVRAHIVKQFTSGAYGWMWPFPRMVEGWIDDALAGIEEEQRKLVG